MTTRALHERADVAGPHTVLGKVPGQNHVAVHVEGQSATAGTW
jgi:hypothetical protein